MAWLASQVKGAMNAVASGPLVSGALSKVAAAAAASPAVQRVQGRLTGTYDVQVAVRSVHFFVGLRKLSAPCTQVERLQQTADATSSSAERAKVLSHWARLLTDCGAATAVSGAEEAPASEGKDGNGAFPPSSALFVRASGSGRELLSFSEVLLRSSAVETCCHKMLDDSQAPSTEELSALRLVLSALCVGGADSAAALVTGLGVLATAAGGYTVDVKASSAELRALVQTCIAALKATPLLESVDDAPSGDSASKEGTHAALAVARRRHRASLRHAESLALRASGSPLAERSSLLRAQAAELAAYSAQLGAACAEAEAVAQSSDELRGDKLKASDAAAQALDSTIGQLQQRQTALRAQLAEVDAELATSLAQRARVLDEREAFAAGSTDALEALRSRREQVTSATRAAQAEALALDAAQALVAAVEAARVGVLGRCAAEAAVQAAQAGDVYAQALCAHGQALSSLAGTLISKLRFCGGSLDDAKVKLEQAHELGMEDVAADLGTTLKRLSTQYCDAEDALGAVLIEADALRAEQATLAHPAPAELEAAMGHLAALQREFDAREKPAALLKATQEATAVPPDVAAAPTSELDAGSMAAPALQVEEVTLRTADVAAEDELDDLLLTPSTPAVASAGADDDWLL